MLGFAIFSYKLQTANGQETIPVHLLFRFYYLHPLFKKESMYTQVGDILKALLELMFISYPRNSY